MGYVLLAIGLLLVICGVAFTFSRKERERTLAKIIMELPDSKEHTGAPEAIRNAKRRGYLMLAIGLVLVAIWAALYS